MDLGSIPGLLSIRSATGESNELPLSNSPSLGFFPSDAGAALSNSRWPPVRQKLTPRRKPVSGGLGGGLGPASEDANPSASKEQGAGGKAKAAHGCVCRHCGQEFEVWYRLGIHLRHTPECQEAVRLLEGENGGGGKKRAKKRRGAARLTDSINSEFATASGGADGFRGVDLNESKSEDRVLWGPDETRVRGGADVQSWGDVRGLSRELVRQKQKEAVRTVCGAPTKNGAKCMRTPLAGGRFCERHERESDGGAVRSSADVTADVTSSEAVKGGAQPEWS